MNLFTHQPKNLNLEREKNSKATSRLSISITRLSTFLNFPRTDDLILESLHNMHGNDQRRKGHFGRTVLDMHVISWMEDEEISEFDDS
jgi:hypothetical protein